MKGLTTTTCLCLKCMYFFKRVRSIIYQVPSIAKYIIHLRLEANRVDLLTTAEGPQINGGEWQGGAAETELHFIQLHRLVKHISQSGRPLTYDWQF